MRVVVRVLLVVLVLAGIGAAVLYSQGLLPGVGRSAEDLSEILLVVAAPDEDGAIVAQVVAVIDVGVSPPTLAAVDPGTPVSIPGTSYSALRDAYAFGGGGGMAEAYRRAEGGAFPLPYVALSPEGLAALMDAVGSISVRIPAPMNVYDGERLYVFDRGPRTIDARETVAVLRGSAFLGAAERESLHRDVAVGIGRALGEWEGGFGDAMTEGVVSSDVRGASVERLGGALRSLEP